VSAESRAVEVLSALDLLLVGLAKDDPAERHAQLSALHRTLIQWRQLAEGPLLLQLVTGVFFQGEELLRLPGWPLARVRESVRTWRRIGLQGLEFGRDVGPVELGDLARAVDHALDEAQPLEEQAFGTLVVAVPDRHVTGPSPGLNGLLRREISAVRASIATGERPDVAPLRGALQLLIDEAFDGVGPKALVVDEEPGEGSTDQLAMLVRRAVAFGCWLGLERQQVQVLALGTVAIDAFDTLEPLEAAREMLRWRGMGDAGAQAVLLVHDGRAAALGRESGLAGRTLLRFARSVRQGPEILVLDEEQEAV